MPTGSTGDFVDEEGEESGSEEIEMVNVDKETKRSEFRPRSRESRMSTLT